MIRATGFRAIAAAFTILALAGCAPESGDGGGEDSTPVGTIAGEVVTLGELDAYIKDELFQRQTQGGRDTEVYQLREREFQRLANERLVEKEAAAQGIEVQELLRREGEKDVAVDDAQVLALFEANRAQLGDQTFESLEPRIRSHLRNQQVQQNTQVFVAKLREEAGVRFELERVRVEVAGSGPSLGPDEAPITIVEFSDYECPYCKRAETIVEGILERYPERVRFVYRHFPLEQIHPRARPAAEAASCAEDQGLFWEYHRKVFEAAPALADADLRSHAEAADSISRGSKRASPTAAVRGASTKTSRRAKRRA